MQAAVLGAGPSGYQIFVEKLQYELILRVF